MADIQTTTFTTEVKTVNSVDYVCWTIRNILALQINKKLLANQKIEFETGENSEYRLRWQLGLKHLVTSNCIGVYLKLLRVNILDSRVLVKLSVNVKRLNNKLQNFGVYERTLKLHDEIVSGDIVSFNQNKAVSALMDSPKALELKFKIETWQTTDFAHGEKDNKKFNTFEQIFISSMRKNYGKLLKDSSCADLKLSVSDGKDFLVHRVVLKAQCPVFESMLPPQNQFSVNKDKAVRVCDVSGKTMEILLWYFYTGELRPSWRDDDSVLEFMYAAGKYQMKDILAMLDEVIGTEEDSDAACSNPLLNLVLKLGLKKAEARLAKRVANGIKKSKSSNKLSNENESVD